MKKKCKVCGHFYVGTLRVHANEDLAHGNQADRERTRCTHCGREFKPYELSPGDGRCNECHP